MISDMELYQQIYGLVNLNKLVILCQVLRKCCMYELYSLICQTNCLIKNEIVKIMAFISNIDITQVYCDIK